MCVCERERGGALLRAGGGGVRALRFSSADSCASRPTHNTTTLTHPWPAIFLTTIATATAPATAAGTSQLKPRALVVAGA